jgi:predicted enzyme related to lactoylglutathione lyase
MNPVVHFEMPYEDSDRAAKFYAEAFGWQPHKFGPEMGNYVVVNTSETDDKTRLPKEPGRINGGFYKRTKPEQCPGVTIAVDDIQAAMQRVQQAGGTVVGGMQTPGQPDDIPGVGLHISFIDTEGNRVSILQPKPTAEVE